MQEASRFLDEIPAVLVTATRQRAQRAGAPEIATPNLGRGARGLWAVPSAGPTSFAPRSSQRSSSPTQPPQEHEVSGAEVSDASELSASGAAGGEVQLQPGDRVLHRLFGDGIVLKVSEEHGATTVVVSFTRAGKKELDLAFAKLQKI
jgi:hypothetical protein